jgi:pimeloyl-[acyl-carrier protein] methyl ester esterase
LLAGLSLLEACDLRPEAERIQTPSLVIHGERDAVTSPAAGRWLARHLPGGRWHPMPGGHAPHLAQPEAFNRTLEAWCETII